VRIVYYGKYKTKEIRLYGCAKLAQVLRHRWHNFADLSL
jgi:hypothetical protein